MTNGPIKLGANCWNQYTDWPAFREAGLRADRLGYDSLWTWDHLYPIVGDHTGPMYEGWLTLAAWAALTERATIGLMVGANPFRNPALVAKMATTLDHISGGRAVLGIGAAWFETEHRAFGLEFGSSPGERLRWLDEAVQIMRGMLHGEQPSGSRYYSADEVLNIPAPVQPRLPILVGGGGERRTLRTVARYADACNLGGGFDKVKRKDEVLRRHCEEVAGMSRRSNAP
jgi:alkanesulfonate monooxygenase SsuD/methylene tetrahydromethanopterin reductase-like flavin-dependent oxidoreductase (luciferase family)